MRIQLFAPKGKGLRHDRVLRKAVFVAETAREQKDLYDLVERIHWVKDEPECAAAAQPGDTAAGGER